MEETIKNYFIEEKKVTEPVAKVLSATLLKYGDIAEEFCYWVKTREYRQEKKLVINGYSAEDVSKLAPHLDGAGVYNFMVTLRDDPEKAVKIIKDKFPNK